MKEDIFFDTASLQTVVALYQESVKEMHSPDFYTIIWFFEGNGTHIIDFDEYEIKNDMVFFLSPLQLHQFKNVTKVEGQVIVFSKDFLENFNSNMSFHIKQDVFNPYKKVSICSLDNDETKVIVLGSLNSILTEYDKGKDMFGHTDYLASLLSMLLINFQRYGKWNNQHESVIMSSEYYNYHLFVDCIERNYKKLHEVKEYAQQLNLSLSTLNKSIFKITKMQPLRLINERIVLEAKRLLRYSMELRIKEIAQELGFEDVSNFTKFFKRNTGMTPTGFREKIKTELNGNISDYSE